MSIALGPPTSVSDLQSVGADLATLTSAAGTQTAGEFSQVLGTVTGLLSAAQDGTSPTAGGSTAGDLLGTNLLLGLDTGGQMQAGASPTTGSAVVQHAEQYLGVPYQWGGTSPSTGFDCSGFVQRVYADLGVSLPRTSQEQAGVGTPVASLANAQPGDLLFFEPGPGGPGHVGIYVGNGMMIDAPHTGTTVQIQPAGQPTEIRRVLPSGTGGVSASLGVPANLAPLFDSASATYGVPAGLLAAVAKQESGFDPSAVSSAGAQGIMQLMPGTAASLGVNPLDPAQAINGAAQMLSGLISQFGSVPLALAAYNAGPGAVRAYGGIPPYAQTQQYVSNIMAMAGSVA